MAESKLEQQASIFDAQAYVQSLTTLPGIYKMLDKKNEIIYIGKAKSLKKRVSSYFKSIAVTPKQQVMVGKIAAIEVIVTQTEGEALLLESQLIKRYKPRYNICLRDDKSYPYIYISSHHDFPRITFHRGAKNKKGKYFGPYPSAGSVRETLKILQKIFPIRQCEDSYYKNRSRPCLQYQINRCTAPCVGLIKQNEYAQELDNTILFLEGKRSILIDQLIAKMEKAAKNLDFEQATHYRNQIALLRSVLEKHIVLGESGDVDIVACATQTKIACVQIFFIRAGQHLDNKIFFLKISHQQTPAKVLQAFIAQYYLERKIPYELLVSHELAEASLLAEVLAKQAGHAVTISVRLRSERSKWLKMAITNTKQALASKIIDKHSLHERFISLRNELGLAKTPKRMECFDISHTQGEQTVASCVVFDQEGPVKSAYRRFNIENIARGDDCAAINQAVSRRFKRIQKDAQPTPDTLFIDGGVGQVNATIKALSGLAINGVTIVGIAKGASRKAGMEKIILAGTNKPLALTPGASGLLLMQHIRDEAHRFAITGHRTRRGKAKKQSTMESIQGLGAKRRQLLLRQFGGLQGVARAGVDALCNTNGISRNLAQKIYATFHHQQND